MSGYDNDYGSAKWKAIVTCSDILISDSCEDQKI